MCNGSWKDKSHNLECPDSCYLLLFGQVFIVNTNVISLWSVGVSCPVSSQIPASPPACSLGSSMRSRDSLGALQVWHSMATAQGSNLGSLSHKCKWSCTSGPNWKSSLSASFISEINVKSDMLISERSDTCESLKGAGVGASVFTWLSIECTVQCCVIKLVLAVKLGLAIPHVGRDSA